MKNTNHNQKSQLFLGGPGGGAPWEIEKRLAWGQSQFVCPKNIVPRPKIAMKQVYMKATELKIDVVSFIFNFPLIACLNLDL